MRLKREACPENKSLVHADRPADLCAALSVGVGAAGVAELTGCTANGAQTRALITTDIDIGATLGFMFAASWFILLILPAADVLMILWAFVDIYVRFCSPTGVRSNT